MLIFREFSPKKTSFSVASISFLSVIGLSVLGTTPIKAQETEIAPIEDTPHQERLGDCQFSPVLYGHANFRGKILRVNRSENRLSDGNNNIFGSACVPDGWRITVYKKRDFNGRSLTIGPGLATTRIRDNLNNNITSVRVYKLNADGRWKEL